MARINSREEFKNYCLRALGAPVLRINVDDQQLEDRIDDALDLFWEYHSDGSELVFLNIQVTLCPILCFLYLVNRAFEEKRFWSVCG